MAQVEHITVDQERSHVVVRFTPTIPHCSMATLIGLCIRVRLIRALPDRFKVPFLSLLFINGVQPHLFSLSLSSLSLSRCHWVSFCVIMWIVATWLTGVVVWSCHRLGSRGSLSFFRSPGFSWILWDSPWILLVLLVLLALLVLMGSAWFSWTQLDSLLFSWAPPRSACSCSPFPGRYYDPRGNSSIRECWY